MAVRIAIEPWPDVRLTSDTEADIGENGLDGGHIILLGDASVLLCRTAAANDRTVSEAKQMLRSAFPLTQSI